MTGFPSVKGFMLALLAFSPFATLSSPANALSIEYARREESRSVTRLPFPTQLVNYIADSFSRDKSIGANASVFSNPGIGTAIVRVSQITPFTVVSGAGFKNGDIAEAFLEGTLKGRLFAEEFGRASVTASAFITPLEAPTRFARYDFSREVRNTVSDESSVNVSYFAPAMLTVGRSYNLNLSLVTRADASGGDLAIADFFTRETFGRDVEGPLGLTANVRPVSTTPVPGPLPVLGLGSALAYSRILKKKIKRRTKPEVAATLS